MSDNQHCYNCCFYKPYYTKGYKQFDRLDFGMCGKTKETKDKHCSCRDFSNKFYARVNRKEAALAAVTENINLLVELKQILEEDDEEALQAFLTDYRRLKRKKPPTP